MPDGHGGAPGRWHPAPQVQLPMQSPFVLHLHPSGLLLLPGIFGAIQVNGVGAAEQLFAVGLGDGLIVGFAVGGGVIASVGVGVAQIDLSSTSPLQSSSIPLQISEPFAPTKQETNTPLLH